MFLGSLFVPLLSFSLDVGTSAPSFALPKLDGIFVLSKNAIGKGWVLLDFFETTCEPCKKELPELEKLGREFSSSGLSVFILASDQLGEKAVAPFFSEHPTALTVLLDRYRVAVGKYGVEQIPSVFLIDRAGKIAFKAEGYSEGTFEKLRAVLTRAGAYAGIKEGGK
jgi:peroxiredoxin